MVLLIIFLRPLSYGISFSTLNKIHFFLYILLQNEQRYILRLLSKNMVQPDLQILHKTDWLMLSVCACSEAYQSFHNNLSGATPLMHIICHTNKLAEIATISNTEPKFYTLQHSLANIVILNGPCTKLLL